MDKDHQYKLDKTVSSVRQKNLLEHTRRVLD